MRVPGQVRSGQVRLECLTCRLHSEQTVVAHDCHGHRYLPSPVPLSGTGEKREGGSKGGPPALAGTREYEQLNRNR